MKRTYIPALYCCECGNETVEGELQYKYHRKQIICAQCLKRKMGSRKVSRITVAELCEILESFKQKGTNSDNMDSTEALENRIAELEQEIAALREELE